MVGATDFIHKPVLWQTLPQRIEFILRAQDNLRALQQQRTEEPRAAAGAAGHASISSMATASCCEHITGADAGRRLEPGGPSRRKPYCRRRLARTPRHECPRRAGGLAHLRVRGRARATTSAASKRGCGRSPMARCWSSSATPPSGAGQVPHRVSGLLRHTHRAAEPPAVGARNGRAIRSGPAHRTPDGAAVPGSGSLQAHQ